jgi:hypothetical protein
MSDTPRTDAKAQFFGFNPDEGEEFVHVDFARELERENATLRADKERLDWLERTSAEISKFDESEDGPEHWECWPSIIMKDRPLLVAANGKTVRAAIDAARKEQP